MNTNGYAYFYTPSIPHFGTTFGTTRTMYHFDTHLGTTPFTTSVDRLTCLGLCGMYKPCLTVRLGAFITVSDNICQLAFYIIIIFRV